METNGDKWNLGDKWRQIEEGERTGRTPPKSKIAKNILASAVQNRQKYFGERRAVLGTGNATFCRVSQVLTGFYARAK